MLLENLYIISNDLDTLDKSPRDVIARNIEERLNNNLEQYKEKIKKTFRYMIDVNSASNDSSLKKLVKKEGVN